MKFIQPLLAAEKTFVEMRDRREISLQTILSNWSAGKAATAADLSSSKLYMKGTIWIGGITFNDTTDAWK